MSGTPGISKRCSVIPWYIFLHIYKQVKKSVILTMMGDQEYISGIHFKREKVQMLGQKKIRVRNKNIIHFFLKRPVYYLKTVKKCHKIQNQV